MMNLAFAGFRHSHIMSLYAAASENKNVTIVGAFEENQDECVATDEVNFTYASYNDVLNDANVDAIAIGDYYGVRGQMVIAALKADKHVICDKPICTSLSELDEIEALVHETGLKVCCMLDLRYMPQIETAQKLIAEGKIGDIVNVSFTGQHCLDYGNRPAWYFEEGKHGGTINDIAIHGIDLVRYLTKKNLTKINCARTWNAYAEKAPAFKDCAQFMAEFEEVSVMADVSYAAPKCNCILPTYWEFTFWGKKGMLKFNYASTDLQLYTTKEEILPCSVTEVTLLDDFALQMAGKASILDCEDILKSQRQALKIQKAADLQ